MWTADLLWELLDGAAKLDERLEPGRVGEYGVGQEDLLPPALHLTVLLLCAAAGRVAVAGLGGRLTIGAGTRTLEIA